MDRIGAELIEKKRRAIREEKATAGGTEIEKRKQKDILTLLIKANMSSDLKPGQALSDEEVINQIPTFIVAGMCLMRHPPPETLPFLGHETTSNATSFALLSLATYPAVQSRLREELLSVSNDDPNMDELNALPYLDAVVKEALRLHSVVPGLNRLSQQDDVIPLSTPFTDKHGRIRTEIAITKGDSVLVPIMVVNKSPRIWGPDAAEFKYACSCFAITFLTFFSPDRWNAVPEAALSVPGVWGNQLTFGAGPKGCIGYKFAILEYVSQFSLSFS